MASSRTRFDSGLRNFIRSYATTALWSSDDLEQNYSTDDIAPETRRKMIFDATSFYRKFKKVFGEPGQAGHDFWLTRNRHGAGFWDRNYPERIAEVLTRGSHAYGEFHLYVGDDGLIHGDTYHRGRPSMKRDPHRRTRSQRDPKRPWSIGDHVQVYGPGTPWHDVTGTVAEMRKRRIDGSIAYLVITSPGPNPVRNGRELVLSEGQLRKIS